MGACLVENAGDIFIFRFTATFAVTLLSLRFVYCVCTVSRRVVDVSRLQDDKVNAVVSCAVSL